MTSANSSYSNPIIPGDWSDPGVVRVGEDYYSVRSTFGWQPALHVAHSRDLIHWRVIGYADDQNALKLTPGETDDGVWGSDIGYNPNNKTFLIYAPVHAKIHVFSSKDPAGPYTHHGEVIDGYDPGFFADENGQTYLTRTGGDIFRLTADGLKIQEGPVSSLPEGEGPEIFQRGEYYYYITSPGGTRPYQDHMIMSYRAPSMEGPWEEDPSNPIMHAPHTTGAKLQGPGHGEVFNTQNGEWFLTYHAYELSHYSLGRQMGMEAVVWKDDDWWTTQNGPLPSESNPLPQLPASTQGMVQSDNYDSHQLGKQWFFHTKPDFKGTLWSLSENPGSLRIHPQQGDLSSPKVMPTTFHQRVTSKEFDVITHIDFEASSSGSAAGLHFYHDPKRNFWLTSTNVKGERVFEVGYYNLPYHSDVDPEGLRPPQVKEILKTSKVKKTILTQVPNTIGSKVYLKIHVDGQENATFFFSKGGQQWQPIDASIYFGDSWHCSRLGKKPGAPDLGWVGCGRSNVWTGTTMGVFSCRETKEHGPPANFNFFKVEVG